MFVPEDFEVPSELVTAAFRLEPLGPEHNEADYQAWTSSIVHIRATPGFAGRAWPAPGLSLAENLGDLRRHADDFALRQGFTYTVIENGTAEVIGCVYVYPPDGEGAAPGADRAAVRSWVRADRADLDAPLYQAVLEWLAASWPFREVSYAERA